MFSDFAGISATFDAFLHYILCKLNTKIFHYFPFFSTICCVDCNFYRPESSQNVTERQCRPQTDYGKPFSSFPPPILSTCPAVSLSKTVLQLPFTPLSAKSPPQHIVFAPWPAWSLTPGQFYAILGIVKSCDEDPAHGKKPREESTLLRGLC